MVLSGATFLARIRHSSSRCHFRHVVYFRLHGSPRMYWSRYEDDFLDEHCSRIISAARRASAVWCTFDNTASGSAIPNALGLVRRVAELMTG